MNKRILAAVAIVVLVLLPLASVGACSKPETPAQSPKPTVAAPAPKTTAPAPTAAAKPAQVKLQLGATSTTSALFAWNVGLAQVINKNVPGYNITVMEAAGSYANVKEMMKGTYDFVLSNFDAANELYNGIETFKGAPWKDVRILWLKDLSWKQFWVRKDSGIKTFSDLAGKKFCPGVAGAAPAVLLTRGMDVTGVKVDVWFADYGDAVTALADGRIAGIGKSSPPDTMDASLLEAHLKKPLTLIGFTEDQAKAIIQKYPTAGMAYYAVGTNKDLPDAGNFWGESGLVGSIGSARMSEEIVYRMAKAIHENWKDVAAAYPPCGPFDPILDAIKGMPKNITVPLHAGIVRYAKEKGMKVPDNLIPPEFSGK